MKRNQYICVGSVRNARMRFCEKKLQSLDARIVNTFTDTERDGVCASTQENIRKRHWMSHLNITADGVNGNDI